MFKTNQAVMASISLPRVMWLLFMTTIVSASEQYPLSYNAAASKLPYICGGEPYFKVGYPECCFRHRNPCPLDPRCPDAPANFITATDANETIGTVEIVLGNDNAVSINALASLNTKRNYISSKLVDYLGLDNTIEKLPSVDVHSLEIFGRNVTINTFVPLSVRVGIKNKLLSDKIFEIIPERKSPDKDVKIPDLVLSLNFLQDAGALAINEAVFITGRESQIESESEGESESESDPLHP